MDAAGNLILLEDQDRSRWHHSQIAEALPLVEEALRGGVGVYALQAEIAALHCQAERAEATDWAQIVRLYQVLERLQPSPIVTLNRAVAIAMADSPQAAFGLINLPQNSTATIYFTLPVQICYGGSEHLKTQSGAIHGRWNW